MLVRSTVRLHQGVTVWLTGLPGAGKSTVAATIASMLRDEDVETEVLDGDELRRTISRDLGFSPEDRDAHCRRVGFIAEMLSSHRILTLVPVIAPLTDTRGAIREHHRSHGTEFVEVYVATPVTECARRDPKGLYARAYAGDLPGLTGVDGVYEQPDDPDLRMDTTDIDAETAALTVLRLLADRGLLEGLSDRN
ncbi:MAG TPA: adenylyl-sulfate kinase [Pseudonocardiaceae bacterium]|nr:adenylyl-sulfate kinase [Pseudonocardiaceae bacterium]